MSRHLNSNTFGNEYEEIYTRESTENSVKFEARNSRASPNGKGGKKEYIRALRKNKRTQRGDLWG